MRRLFAGAAALVLFSSCSLISYSQYPQEYNQFKTTVREAYPYRAPDPRPDTFLAGASKIEITPTASLGKLWLGGYSRPRPAQGVHDPLWARCIVVTDQKGNAVVIVSLDLVGFFYNDTEIIRQKAKTFLPHGEIVVTTTHNHSGPDTLGVFGPSVLEIPLRSGRNENYIRFVQNQVIACIGDAVENQQPAQFSVSSAQLSGISRNLREPGFVDAAAVGLIVYQSTTRCPIFAILNFGVHPEIMMSDYVSADFVGSWYERVEKQHAVERCEKFVAMFLNGALGAMVVPESPNLHTLEELPDMRTWQYDSKRFGPDMPDAWGNREWFARRLDQKLQQKIDEGIMFREIKPVAFRFRRSVFSVPLKNNLFWWAWRLGVIKRPDYAEGNITTAVSYLQIGELGIVFLPGETPPQLALALRETLKTKHSFVMVVSLADDELGYLLNRVQAQNPLYEYEQTMCVNPDIADILLSELEKLFLP